MNIILDMDNEILYGSDQAYISYPTRFATVTLPLLPSEDLCTAVNNLRADYAPVDDMDFSSESMISRQQSRIIVSRP